MALSGSVSVSVTKYNTLTFSWSASQSVSGNYSTVSWSMRLSSTAYGRISSSTSKSWSVNVNGSSYSGSNTVGISANSSKTLASGSTRVNHNADGTKTFSFSFSQQFNINFNGWVGTKSGSGSGTLNTIPRASSLTVPTINFGESGTLTISRASSSFTHTVKAQFGTSVYGTTIATKTTATSLTFDLPLEWANGIPNSQTGTCTYTIETYNGSTLIGTKTTTGTLKLLEADGAPTIDSCVASDGVQDVADKIGLFVQSKSKLKTVTTATGKLGATIQSYATSFEGLNYNGATTTTDFIKGDSTIPFTVTVTDSRGFTKTYSGSILVLTYNAPKINAFSALRCDESGTADDEGSRLNIVRNWTITVLRNKNDNAWKLEYRKQGATTWTALANGTGYSFNDTYISEAVFDVDFAYELKVTVSDYWSSISQIIEIPTAFTLVDYHSSGKGIAFGKVAETANLFDVSLPALFREKIDLESEMYDKFGTRINNGLARYTGSAAKAIDPDTTIDELILTDVNTPWTGFAYIMTMFYGSKTPTSPRTQIAFPYTNGRIAQRMYKAGAWTEWQTYQYIISDETVNGWRVTKYGNQRIRMTWAGYVTFGATTVVGGRHRSLYAMKFPLTLKKVTNSSVAGSTVGTDIGINWGNAVGNLNNVDGCNITLHSNVALTGGISNVAVTLLVEGE